ncbi:MAG: hypothetical protein ACK5Q5_06245 [Planctomycetaceae bacterium]
MTNRTSHHTAFVSLARIPAQVVAVCVLLSANISLAQPWVGSPPRAFGSPPVVWLVPDATCETCPPSAAVVQQFAARPVSQNCNFAVRATEDFANRVVVRKQTQQGPVRDFVMGADVYGDQSTTTTTRVNFIPCETAARLQLQVDGDIDSRTTGVTPQAQVQSLGRHHFQLVKEIDFDGLAVSTRTPAVFVSPTQQHVGAQTTLSRFPLLGQVASNIALQQAYARNPQAARITADRITQQAAPEFNQRIDAELSRLNQLLSGQVHNQLQQYGLAPKFHGLSTSDQDLLWCVTLDVPTPPPALPAEWTGMNSGRAGGLYLHDSLINDLLARLPLGGMEVPDAAIDRWFQLLARGEGLAALSNAGEPIAPQFATIVFDRRQPVRLTFENGQFELILRIGFKPVAGPQIPTQELTIPFTVELSETDVRFHPGEVSLVAGDPAAATGLLDEAARVLIREQVQSKLQSRTAPRTLPVELPDAPRTEVQVKEVRLQGGWLSVTFD